MRPQLEPVRRPRVRVVADTAVVSEALTFVALVPVWIVVGLVAAQIGLVIGRAITGAIL